MSKHVSQEFEYQNLSDIKWLFRERRYKCFITIKPDPKKGDPSLHQLVKYLKARDVLYWIVRCDSAKGFGHYHGVISFSNDMPADAYENCKANLHRFVNRYYGRFSPFGVTDLETLYYYVRSPDRNKNIYEMVSDRVDPTPSLD